ncbi:PD-(D/E)XK motif protein [Bacillus sp. 123MFChir2]|uniref:PD-(D/E)XK motif protein n=1 Tax=Bacillus sp. 123MFChir2 TaxID=1169144 RepID=UPI0003773DD7|nr:PD-(D/E)XK motif protein [Bacillus sp. 123MFChir2]
MIRIKSEFEQMIQGIDNQAVRDVYKLKLISTAMPYLLAGIDTLNMHRQLYVDLGKLPWEEEQLRSLPRWRGLSIKIEYFERMGPLKERYFLILSQESEESSEIFEAVLQNLIDHITYMEQEDTLFGVIYRVLDRWRNFFSKGGYKRLNDEKQQGLFGELYYIQKWMERFPNQPPLLIEHWEGPTSGRIDFRNSRCGVEIKTCCEKLRKEIKISNEKQLKLTDTVHNLYLYVCFIETNQAAGKTLQEIVDEIREMLREKSQRLLLKFNDLLLELGFKDDEYVDKMFFVHAEETYHVIDKFPKISDELLPKGISHVSYYVDLTHCKEFECSLDKVFSL